MSNGLLNVTLLTPDGLITGISYKGQELLEILNLEDDREYVHIYIYISLNKFSLSFSFSISKSVTQTQPDFFTNSLLHESLMELHKIQVLGCCLEHARF